MKNEPKLKFLLGLLFILGGYFFFTAPKIFEGYSKGFLGEVKVAVFIKDDKIQDIKVTGYSDTPKMAEVAFNNLIKTIKETQDLEVDGIAGATHSSNGLKSAVAMAVQASGVKLKKIDRVASVNEVKDETTDIVIVGGGGAGLAAAIEAKEKGANVILVEKMPILGGNTNYATGGINASNSKFQKNNDSNELFYNDTMKGGKYKNNPILVKTLVEKSAEAIDWLVERGANLTDVGRLGGASEDRAHRPEGGEKVGPNIVESLANKAENLDIDTRVMTAAVSITSDGGKIDGIIAETNGQKYKIKTKAVILATGGFGNNSKLFSTLNPSLKGFVSTNHPGATGDAIELVEKYNVALVDMNEIQTHPTVVPSNKTMISEAVRGNGAILINRDGQRFINELETRDVVSKAILDQEGKTSYLVFDQGIRESLKAIEEYIKMGIIVEAKTMEELSKNLNIPKDNLKASLSKYNKYVSENKDAEFNRENLIRKIETGPFYAVEIAPAVHHTMGGIKINEKTEVYNNDGIIVSGLFAAGEVTGGVHGANRLGGNALSDIIVFGRIAGDSAFEYSKK